MKPIRQISNIEFKLSARGNEFTLRKEGKEWAMYVVNATVRAYNRGLAIPKYFDSIEEVEAKYKSWKGITQLIKQGKVKMSLQAFDKNLYVSIEDAINNGATYLISDETDYLTYGVLDTITNAVTNSVKAFADKNIEFFVSHGDTNYTLDIINAYLNSRRGESLSDILLKNNKPKMTKAIFSKIYDELIQQNAKADGVGYDEMLDAMFTESFTLQ